ncbi:autoinducer binding domain-containing protein [Aliagarivorans taiwanensis]|uniref:autoinducer binding domain-containing protein n=1 Tax=Aliagarivorans taiwanensis TaxID=561966 RepID=UPI00040195DD|nr:autoinducer binding domain-containing protein [Aliagarivorans taiwanensis]
MDSWLEQELNSLESSNTSRDYFEHLNRVAKEFGFEYCAFALRQAYPISSPKTEILTSYPLSWQLQYHRNNYIEVDPTVKHALQSQLPVVWNEHLSQQQPEFWEDARSFGIQYGWSQSTRNGDGSVGLLAFSRANEEVSPQEIKEHCYRLMWLAQLTHHGLSGRLSREGGRSYNLTEREIEMLKWTADGKTAEEIAVILSISARTVNFHIGQAVSKLQVANKTSATVKAALEGLLA